MVRTVAIILVAFGASCALSSAGFAAAKCSSISAQCAVEIGGVCDPATGRWQYGRPTAGGTNKGGAFDACIARKLKERK